MFDRFDSYVDQYDDWQRLCGLYPDPEADWIDNMNRQDWLWEKGPIGAWPENTIEEAA